MKRLQDQEAFLRLLSKGKLKRRQSLLKEASKKELTTLCEICLNILKGNVHISPTTKQKLKRHKKLIRTLGNKKISYKRKRHLIHQKGSGVGAIVGTIASLVLPLLGKLIK